MWQKHEENHEQFMNKHFHFKDFVEAFSFMSQIAFLAEKMNHHPTLTNTYNIVDIKLSTHDSGGIITEKDVELSEAIDKIYHDYYH